MHVSTCPFDPATLYPVWADLQQLLTALKPKLVIATTPSNPGGLVWSAEAIERLVRSPPSFCVHSATSPRLSPARARG